jgi:hypothetical protein
MDLFEKIQKIEALFESSNSPGEKRAALEAKERLLKRHAEENPIECTIRVGDLWKKRLFVAICRKYGIDTYRYKGQKYTTTMLTTTRSFIDKVLWPEFLKHSKILEELVTEVLSDLISKIHEDDQEETIISGNISSLI